MHEATQAILAEFSAALRQGSRPSIDVYLERVESAERESLFCELLRVEVKHRRQFDEMFVADEYSSRFPQYERQLREYFAEEDSASFTLNSTVFEPKATRPVNSEVLQISSEYFPPPPASPPGSPPGSSPGDSAPGPSSSGMGRYQLQELIGRGGFGEVWRAKDPVLDRIVAIKRPRSDVEMSDVLIEQLLFEARRVAQLKSPGIVPVYDVGRAENTFFIVSDFIEGDTLEKRMRSGTLSLTESVELVAQVAATLHEAHLKDVVHRDIKPGNILLNRDGRPFVTDFGLAVSELEQVQESGTLLGTWTYMSPEQARGESNRLDARSDIFSLGIVFYQLLANRLPFRAASKLEYRDQLLNREIRPPRTINDKIPRELERICLACVEKHPSDRYTTALDLANDLRAWLRNESSMSSSSLATSLSPSPTPSSASMPTVQSVFAGVSSNGGLGNVALSKRTIILAVVLMAVCAASISVITSLVMRPVPNLVVTVPPTAQIEPPPPVPTPAEKEWVAGGATLPEHLIYPGYKHWGTPPGAFRPDAMEFQVLSNISERVSSSELYTLGKFDSEKPTRFSINIDQSIWSGGCGLFYGYREEPILGKNRTQAVFNVIWIRSELPPGVQPQKFFLQRAICRIDPDNQYASVEEVGFGAGIPFVELVGGRELSFDITAGLVTEVRWGNKPMPRLLQFVRADNPAMKNWRGPWGIVHLVGTTLFRGPKISEILPPVRVATAP